MRLGIKVSKSQQPRGLIVLAEIENVPLFFFPSFFLANVQKFAIRRESPNSICWAGYKKPNSVFNTITQIPLKIEGSKIYVN